MAHPYLVAPAPYLAFRVAGATPRPAGRGVLGGHPEAGPGGRAAPGDARARPHGGRRKRRSAPPEGQSAEPRFLPLCSRARQAQRRDPGGGRGSREHPPRPPVPAPPLPVPGLRADPQAPPWRQGFPLRVYPRTCSSWGSSLNAGGRRGGTRRGTHPPQILGPHSLSSPRTPLSVVTFNFPRPATHPALRGPPEGH